MKFNNDEILTMLNFNLIENLPRRKFNNNEKVNLIENLTTMKKLTSLKI